MPLSVSKQKRPFIVAKDTRQWTSGVVRFAVMTVEDHPEATYIIFEKDLLGRGPKGSQRFNLRLHDWNNLKKLIEVELAEKHQWLLDVSGLAIVPADSLEDICKILDSNPKYLSKILDYPSLEKLSKESFESLNRLAVRIYEVQSKNIDAILNKLSRARSDEFGQFASLLNDLRLGQISSLANIISQKIRIIELFEQITTSMETKEKEIHILIENNVWIAGKKYEITSSDETLQKYLGESVEPDPELRKRPDLIVRRIPYQDELVLIELKRPEIKLMPRHIGQILEYKALIENYRPNVKNIDCFLFGYERHPSYSISSKDVTIKTFSELSEELKDEYKEYVDVLKQTRKEIENFEFLVEEQEKSLDVEDDIPF
jgi:hypothetical protein